MYCSDECGGGRRKKGQYRVALVVREKITRAAEYIPEPNSGRLLFIFLTVRSPQ